jgi:hypothetical protein
MVGHPDIWPPPPRDIRIAGDSDTHGFLGCIQLRNCHICTGVTNASGYAAVIAAVSSCAPGEEWSVGGIQLDSVPTHRYSNRPGGFRLVILGMVPSICRGHHRSRSPRTSWSVASCCMCVRSLVRSDGWTVSGLGEPRIPDGHDAGSACGPPYPVLYYCGNPHHYAVHCPWEPNVGGAASQDRFNRTARNRWNW